jgi:hypothetical protein
MEVFEIHITGDERIMSASRSLGVKAIAVELLSPDMRVLRVEHMTSQIAKFDVYEDCEVYVLSLAKKLVDLGVEIYRVKIESPYREHFVSRSLYVESHFPARSGYASRNVLKTEKLGTAREYDVSGYGDFVKKHAGDEIEMCLYDSCPYEDRDWLKLY